MYIAFKWLLFLTLFMWLVLCFIDLVVKRFIEDKTSVTDQPVWFYRTVTTNTTEVVPNSQRERRFRGPRPGPRRPHCDVALLHYLLFFSGALAGALYNRKRLFLSYAQSQFANVSRICKLSTHFRLSDLNIDLPKLNETAVQISVAILETLLKTWEFLKNMIAKYQNRSKGHENCYKLNLLLLKKVKEIAEERNKLGSILIAAIKANRNLKMRYKVQGIAKSHLVRHIEDVQKHIKENKTKYNAFYQHHMLIQQENAFLKSFVKKLQAEKYDAQRSLMSLVDLIYMSKNSELQAYCTRNIVHSTGGGVTSSNANVTAEIQKILGKIRPEASGKNSVDRSGVRVGATRSWTSSRITEAIPEEESLVPLSPDGPKLRGLPGEYVWTVKDKNGLIEKLYEYECQCNFDNPDTIQRIREYSVYHDKDCLLDFSKYREDTSRQKFLTGSRPFQDFLKNNSENLVATTTCSQPHLKLLSG